MKRRLNTWLLIAVFLLAAAVRVGVALRSPLWADETFSLAVATGHSLEHPAHVADPAQGDFVETSRPLTAMEFRRYLEHENPPASLARVLRAVKLSDTSPPLYYVLLYGWTRVLGTSDLALRLFSIGWALACLPLLASIARRVGGGRAAVAACALFAFAPPSVYYSTEGRMYSLLWFCILATAQLTLILRERGGRPGWCALWVLASVAGFWTHYFFLFPWTASVVFLALRPGQLTRLRLAASVLLMVVLVAPWYVKAPENLSNWRVTQGWLQMEPGRFDRLSATTDFTLQFFTGKSARYWKLHRRSTAAALALFGVVAAIMIWRLRSQAFDRRRLLLWLWFAAGCSGPLVYDFVQRAYTVDTPRYAMGALPAAYLLAAVGLACLRFRARSAILLLILVAWTPSLLSIYRNPTRSSGPRYWDVSRKIAADTTESDLILMHAIPSAALTFTRYVESPAGLATWVGQLRARQVPDSLHALAEGRRRIIFLRFHDVGAPAPEEEWLRAHAVVHSEKFLGPMLVVDFRPRDGLTFTPVSTPSVVQASRADRRLDFLPAAEAAIRVSLTPASGTVR